MWKIEFIAYELRQEDINGTLLLVVVNYKTSNFKA